MSDLFGWFLLALPEKIFSKKELQIRDFESFIFWSKFRFLGHCFRAFQPVLFLNFLSLVNHGGRHFYSSQNLRTLRSIRPEVFCKKGVLRNLERFTEKHLCQSLFFNKVAGLSLQVFPCEFCEIYKNIFFYRTLLVAASED